MLAVAECHPHDHDDLEVVEQVEGDLAHVAELPRPGDQLTNGLPQEQRHDDGHAQLHQQVQHVDLGRRVLGLG